MRDIRVHPGALVLYRPEDVAGGYRLDVRPGGVFMPCPANATAEDLAGIVAAHAKILEAFRSLASVARGAASVAASATNTT